MFSEEKSNHKQRRKNGFYACARFLSCLLSGVCPLQLYLLSSVFFNGSMCFFLTRTEEYLVISF